MIITNNALAMGALALSALTPALLYIGIAVAALGVIVAGLVGIISLVHNRKHATPTYFESRLQEGMMRMHPQADTADLDEETSAQQDEQVDETATSDDTAIVEVEDDVITPYGYTEDVIDGSVQEDAVTEDAATEQQSEDATATEDAARTDTVTEDAAQQVADQADVSTDAATDDTVTQADAVREDTQDDVATDARQAQDAAQTDAAAPKEQVTDRPVQETRTAAGSDEVSARDVADTQAKSRPKTAQDTKALFDVIVGSESEWEAQTAQEVADMDVQVSDPEDEMLTRMVSNDNGDLDNFDFDSDFGDFDLFKAETQSATDDVERLALLNAFVQQEGEDEWDNDEAADAEEAAEEAEAIEEEAADETAAAMGLDGVFRSRYTRTFRAKLRQSSDEVKAYYTALYNELMGYEKMRVSTDMNAFALGRRTFVRMAIMGKTLCVFLALDPKGFDPDRFHHKDKWHGKAGHSG